VGVSVFQVIRIFKHLAIFPFSILIIVDKREER
jgi:hypothetical protein